jgi:demethylmenaquinone methyltransferase/2-methoxy-6-polyprenyl-1,4-benzoquinol methylase
MSLTAMPDPVAAVETAARCLRPDGRVAVLDARPFQSLPLRLLNPLVVPVSRAATNWDHATDVPATIESRFEDSSVDSYNDGTVYVAVGRRPSTGDPSAD